MRGECPCKMCVCVPTCRHKVYVLMWAQCSLVNNYLYVKLPGSNAHENVLFLERLQSVVDHLEPTTWDMSTIVREEIRDGTYWKRKEAG